MQYISFSDKEFRKRMFVWRQDLPGLPLKFRNDALKNVLVVIDCTPIFIEKPGNYKKQSNTFSVYKHANVYNLLIGTTPWGGMAYMSVPFEGAMSDRRIVEDSDFLPFLEEGDDVLGNTNLFLKPFFMFEELNLATKFNFLKPKNFCSGHKFCSVFYVLVYKKNQSFITTAWWLTHHSCFTTHSSFNKFSNCSEIFERPLKKSASTQKMIIAVSVTHCFKFDKYEQ